MKNKAIVSIISTITLIASLMTLSAYSGEQQPGVMPAEKIVALPPPKLDGTMSLEKALTTRRSIRQFSGKEFTMEQIGQLAWAGQGITEKQKGLRTAPSARASYPITLYLVTPSGLYSYLPDKHALNMQSETDLRQKIAGRQSAIPQSGCTFVIASRVRDTAGKYGDRAGKSAVLEAGHIAQNILLEATSMGLGGVPIGGYDPNQVGKICNLPADSEPVYLVATGFPVEQKAPVIEQKK